MLEPKDVVSNYIGKEVRCTGNNSGSGLTIGEIYYIKSKSGVGAGTTITVSKTPRGPIVGGWGYLYEFDHPTMSIKSLEEEISNMRKEIAKFNQDIKVKEDILQFMKDNKLDEVNPDLLKTFKIMKKLNLGTLDDAKEVVEILNS